MHGRTPLRVGLSRVSMWHFSVEWVVLSIGCILCDVMHAWTHSSMGSKLSYHEMLEMTDMGALLDGLSLATMYWVSSHAMAHEILSHCWGWPSPELGLEYLLEGVANPRRVSYIQVVWELTYPILGWVGQHTCDEVTLLCPWRWWPHGIACGEPCGIAHGGPFLTKCLPSLRGSVGAATSVRHSPCNGEEKEKISWTIEQ